MLYEEEVGATSAILGELCVAPCMGARAFPANLNSHLTDTRSPLNNSLGKPARKHHSLLDTQCFLEFTPHQLTLSRLRKIEPEEHRLYTVLAIYVAAVRPRSVTLAHVCRTQGVTCKVAQEPLHRFLYCRSPFFAISASLFCYCRIIFLLLPHHFFFSSTLKAQKFSSYPTVTNPTAKGDNDINRRLYNYFILLYFFRVICSQKDHQKESDIGEESFLQKLLFTTRYTCFHSFQPFFAVQTAMKRSPHPAGRALRTQGKFVALAWTRVTPHPPALRVTRQHILPVR